MTPWELMANTVYNRGSQAGRSLWTAVVQLEIIDYWPVFLGALAVIVEKIDNEYERNLFHAAAIEKIPVGFEGDPRKKLPYDYSKAYDAYVKNLSQGSKYYYS